MRRNRDAIAVGKTLNRFFENDAPVVLGYCGISLAVYCLNLCLPWLVADVFSWPAWLYRKPFSIMTHFRLFAHAAGHQEWGHLKGNILLICLVGPACERAHGGAALLRVLAVVAVCTALAHSCTKPHTIVFGASGSVFALIMLSTYANYKGSRVPITSVVVAILWLAGEVWDLVLSRASGVSNIAHLAGGLLGVFCGISMQAADGRGRTASWLRRCMGLKAPVRGEVLARFGRWLRSGQRPV